MASQVLRENPCHHVIVIPLLLLLCSSVFWTDAAPVGPAAETPKRSNHDSAPLKFDSCWGEAYSSEYSCENVIKASEQDNPHLKPFISKGDQNENVKVTFTLSKPSTVRRVTFSIEGYKGFYSIQSDKCFGSLSGVELFVEGYRGSPGMSSPGDSPGIGASLGGSLSGIGASLGGSLSGIGASFGGGSPGIGGYLGRGPYGVGASLGGSLSGIGASVGGGSAGIGGYLGRGPYGVGASLGGGLSGIGASVGGGSPGIGASLGRGSLDLSGLGTHAGGPLSKRLLGNRFILQCGKAEDGDRDESVTFTCDTGQDGFVDRLIFSRKPLPISAMLGLGRHTSQRLTLVKVKAYTD